MPKNIEIKARVTDRDALIKQAQQLATETPITLEQTDTFFHSPVGRLKLREFQDHTAELVFYRRGDREEPTASHYVRTPVVDPEKTKAILSGALGQRGIVKKKRVVYMIGQTRLHIDQVRDLGSFMELEVVLRPNQSEERAKAIANGLMRELNIHVENLEATAYIDLLENA